MVAQNKKNNRSDGKWYNMEKEWAKALNEKTPKKVSIKIKPSYSGNSLRPDLFKVKKTIENKIG